MFESSRLSFQNERMPSLRSKNAAEYHKQAKDDFQYKQNVTKKAGEIICTYLEIDAD